MIFEVFPFSWQTAIRPYTMIDKMQIWMNHILIKKQWVFSLHKQQS